MTNCLEGKYLMLCNLWARCNQCNSGTTTERYMRNHMERMHQGGGSLTNCVEVRPPFPGTAEWYSRVVQQNGTAEWYSRVVQQQQESRLGEMGIGGLVGWRMHRREQCNLSQSSSSARVRRFPVHWSSDCVHCGGELCVMQCLSDSSAMMISGSPGLLMDDV